MHVAAPVPVEINLMQQSRLLRLSYENGEQYDLSYEFLRVLTPSAEARGHGPGQETLQHGKREVSITAIHPIGNYAIQPVFSDGHDSGIYSWDMLYNFCQHHEELWQSYLLAMEQQGLSR